MFNPIHEVQRVSNAPDNLNYEDFLLICKNLGIAQSLQITTEQVQEWYRELKLKGFTRSKAIHRAQVIKQKELFGRIALREWFDESDLMYNEYEMIQESRRRIKRMIDRAESIRKNGNRPLTGQEIHECEVCAAHNFILEANLDLDRVKQDYIEKQKAILTAQDQAKKNKMKGLTYDQFLRIRDLKPHLFYGKLAPSELYPFRLQMSPELSLEQILSVFDDDTAVLDADNTQI